MRQRLRSLIWPARGWRRAFQYYWKRLLRLQGSPTSIARGFAIGTAFGITPLIGIHLWLALFLAYVTRSSLIAATAGVFFLGNYLTIFPVLLLDYEIGKYLFSAAGIAFEGSDNSITIMYLIEQPLAFTRDLWHQPQLVLPLFLPTLLGSVVLGGVLYIVSMAVVRDSISSFREKRK
jgi:uncharacterized protein (DUF2062 family)